MRSDGRAAPPTGERGHKSPASPPASPTSLHGAGDVVDLAVVAEISTQLDDLELALELLDAARWRLAA